MAIYEVVMSGVCWSQNFINRFHYASPNSGSPVGGGAADVLEAFIANVLPSIRGISPNHGAFSIRDFTARDLYDDTDFSEDVGNAFAGLAGASEPAPPFVAIAYRTPRLRVGRNRGYKRFCGIPEQKIAGNTWGDASGAADIALKAALEAFLPIPLAAPVDFFQPVILFLEKVVDPDTGNDVWQPYASEVTQRANMAGAVEWNFNRLTTQRSRIAGQGI